MSKRVIRTESIQGAIAQFYQLAHQCGDVEDQLAAPGVTKAVLADLTKRLAALERGMDAAVRQINSWSCANLSDAVFKLAWLSETDPRGNEPVQYVGSWVAYQNVLQDMEKAAGVEALAFVQAVRNSRMACEPSSN